MTKPKEELLEEAKLRYPINTKFKVVHHPEVERTVYSHNSVKNNFVHASDGLHINLLIDTTDTASVYFNGKWAEITHYVIPEKWCVKVNSSHLDYPELYQWRLESPVSCNWGNHEGYIHSTGIHYLDIKTGYTEIRIEDFIKYIYKGNTETTKTKEPSKYCEYWKYIEDNLSGFTKDKIYKTLYPENVNKCSSFINNYGKEDGWLGKNTEKFIPSTYEEYCKQEGINVVPKYVKVICSWHNDWTTDKIYKVEDTQRTFPDRLYVRCDKKRLVDVCNWEKNFKICTEEEYLAQNPKKEEPMEDYTGKIPKLHMADEAGQWVTDRFIGKTWVSGRGTSTFWPIKFDTYKPEKKQIKIIELPKVKKRFVY